MAAVSFVMIVPTLNGAVGGEVATSVATIAPVPMLREGVHSQVPVESPALKAPFSREEVFAFFSAVKVLGDYVGPEGHATIYMTYPEPQRAKIVRDMFQDFLTQYEARRAPEERLSRRDAIQALIAMAPVFGQEAMQFEKEKGQPFSRDRGMMRFSNHISLHFLWELWWAELRAES